jgi:hypothetical protein
LAHHNNNKPKKYKIEALEAPSNRSLYVKIKWLTFDPPIYVKKGELWANHKG